MLSIDSELLEAASAIAAAAPPTPPVVDDWKTRRANIDALYGGLAAASTPDNRIEVVDFTMPSLDGSAIPLRLYKPKNLPNALVVYIHGGGLIAGNIDGYDHVCRRYALEAGVAMLAVDYRLAPESPYPRAVEDSVAAVQWAIEHAAERVPGARVALMGDSAGGGLAAATAIVCRDRRIGPLAAQILVYPMLDDRTAATDPAVEPFLAWSVADNITGWRAYLGDKYGTGNVPASASAARSGSLHDLPTAYLEVGQLDLFCTETVAYATRLMEHGVAVHLCVRPGAFHGFDQLAPASRIAQSAFADRVAFLRAL
ncbi:alpha/beta hydrolase fold domain-containing protein [Micromonospora sp. NBC_01813]|uniref:alpha/beta hydrolase fold domain-containing protein n=1 Tax=Micromonospora sp. NBC_01813 TaxID=2975988 RepID=UPI002DD996BC|nr:alpha/beta hydrolase fold domain-containing protein [Micromonospora sp. NBC_01813]WSA08275.1 alpha/beta hydrolase [Micromonospora sp. NBC_01813]